MMPPIPRASPQLLCSEVNHRLQEFVPRHIPGEIPSGENQSNGAQEHETPGGQLHRSVPHLFYDLAMLQSHSLWALVVLTLYSSGSDPPVLEVLIHLFQ